jgi:hypothetical protein
MSELASGRRQPSRSLSRIERRHTTSREDAFSVDVNIKLSVGFRVSESSLEDALAEYDEVTVEGLLREIIDKAIACDEISTKVEEGPNTLEDLDALKGD